MREDVQLDEVFRLFMSSAVHMLLVRRAAGSRPGSPAGQPGREGAPLGEVVGLITLEDVMEELIQVRVSLPCLEQKPFSNGKSKAGFQ